METKGNEGAAAVCTRQNVHNDQRQPRQISVESYSNNQMEKIDDDPKGILPVSSRETTPQVDCHVSEYVDEKGFFSGNPFVEVTKGIIHIYKKK